MTMNDRDIDRHYTLICQKWVESERGWGTRPDGYSLHVTDEDRRSFVKEYWKEMPDVVPDEYSRPDGTPYLIEVNEETYKLVKRTKNGERFFDTAPGSGGSDGWIPQAKDVHVMKDEGFSAYKPYEAFDLEPNRENRMRSGWHRILARIARRFGRPRGHV
jgi:hypothetical protein